MLDDFRTGETTADRADFLVELRDSNPQSSAIDLQ
jgi:hypothetical protein